LNNTSFEEFALLLSEVYDLDLHLHPQSWLVYRKWKGFLPLKVPFDTILKMESDLDRLENELGVDIGILDNPTRHAAYQEYFTQRSLNAANKLYMPDFNLFGYQMD
jgi:hypothetical protein